MRSIDLAREHGLSAQAIRNYEDVGILPPTERSETGYRHYTARHAQALRAFLALRRGHGHQQAMEIMRATNRGDTESAYRLIDAAHVMLLAERDTRTESATALGSLSTTVPRPVIGRPYLLRQVAQFVDALREAGGAAALGAFLASWHERLTTRSRHLLAGAAHLDAYLTLIDQTPAG